MRFLDPSKESIAYPIPKVAHPGGPQIYCFSVARTGPEMDSWRRDDFCFCTCFWMLSAANILYADERWVDVQKCTMHIHIKKCVWIHADIFLHVYTCTCSFSYTPVTCLSSDLVRHQTCFVIYFYVSPIYTVKSDLVLPFEHGFWSWMILARF